MLDAVAEVTPDDLACVVDAEGAREAQRIVEGGVGAAVRVVEKAVAAGSPTIWPKSLMPYAMVWRVDKGSSRVV
jgi:hypothetical protein